MLNLLFFIAKKYIFNCKLNDIMPSMVGVQCKIEQYKSYEHQIAIKNGTLSKYERFWGPLNVIFQ